MKDFWSSTPLRWALILSLLAHVALMASASRWARPDHRLPDIDNLRVVQVDPSELPSFPPEEEPPLPPLPPPGTEPPIPDRFASPLLEPPVPATRPKAKPRPRAQAPRPRSASPRRRPSDSAAPARAVRPRDSRRIAAAPGGGRSGVSPAPRGDARPEAPSGAPSGVPDDGEAGLEEVPEGPIDLQPAQAEEGEDSTKLTPITQGSLIAVNSKVKGQVGAAFARVKPFNGPGVFYTTVLDVPASAPPGTVYKLEFTEVVLAGEDAKPVEFTPQSGTLTVVPSNAPLPPAQTPSLTGNSIGVGHLYAHRGTQVTIEVYAGEGLKRISGVQAKLKFSDVKEGRRKRRRPTPSTAPPSVTPSSVSPAALPPSRPSPVSGE
ncbi:MAG: hypothetical protein KY468_04925 [Armatimonadetes bacterium]|nr:hypothetical protein [Armatimonadota bacterium]